MKKLKGLNYDLTEVLLFSDVNYFIDETTDVEMISKNPSSKQRNILIDDYVSGKKRLIYPCYDNIVITQKYIDLVFPKIKYFFSKDNFNLSIIVNKDYEIEKNSYLIELMKDDSFTVEFFENDLLLIINLWR
ncbi:hypothetical protein [Mycoplasma sp. P36-A1]|uniref:hypothetical protein n=1 Tax=Mycoplasma sp. P36-A1 TaxID=3252900 RepID=UPI003C2E4929